VAVSKEGGVKGNITSQAKYLSFRNASWEQLLLAGKIWLAWKLWPV